MELGIYESLVTQVVQERINKLDNNHFFIESKTLDREEAILYLTRHFCEALSRAFKVIKDVRKENLVVHQIQIINKLVTYLQQEIAEYEHSEDLLSLEGKVLTGIVDRLNSDYKDIGLRLKEITPVSRLTQSELFTGGNLGVSLDGELKREILSADRVDLLVSFIKWKAVVILREALMEFTKRGGKLRVITTTYMGATDAKAINELAKLPNTEIKVSYNTGNERLHAKAYFFYRKTGFHTAYIGSSNFSRSALTDGLEWNVKVTTKEIPHIIDKFQKTFNTYWYNEEFEVYNPNKDYEKISEALKQSKIGRKDSQDVITFFDIKPYHYQKEILEKLSVERKVHNSYKNLVVAATGTGKTMIAAFDFKRILEENKDVRLLFIAHRIDILRQARNTFRQVLRDANFGELYGNGYEIQNKRYVFATIQTLYNALPKGEITSDYYDYIVFDEVHHAKASTYQVVLGFFKPEIILGLTATPERMDGGDILEDFNGRIAAEIRLPDALNNKLLCPFQYFAVSDSVDLRNVSWKNGRYDSNELTKAYIDNDARVGEVLRYIDKYTKGLNEVTALAFCATKEHAYYMNKKFQSQGVLSEALTSDQSQNREQLIQSLKNKTINFLFVVDIFNEGIDVPEIDTVLFLRPTESLTIFLQQLGRGLRLSEGKEALTVLDFVGNARDEYDFENKFRALVGKTNTTIKQEIEKDFPHLPLGCSIVLERQAKEYILNNIKKATNYNKRSLIQKIRAFNQHTNLPLTVYNFTTFYNIDLKALYKSELFTTLKREAFHNADSVVESVNLKLYRSMLTKKWLVTESLSYFMFILKLIKVNFQLDKLDNTEEIRLMALMLHYDFWQEAKQDITLEDSLLIIGQDEYLITEMKEFIECKVQLLSFEEIACKNLEYELPLRMHARYTRGQILVAFRLSTIDKQSSNREGVAENKDLNTEVLFINLQKSEEDFSPTTMYDDYAINEILFHWQSQNQTADISPKGRSYIEQVENGKKIALFVREAKKDMWGNTQGFIFLGFAEINSYYGSKPMSITWKLEEPLPNYVWKETLKLRIG